VNPRNDLYLALPDVTVAPATVATTPHQPGLRTLSYQRRQIASAAGYSRSRTVTRLPGCPAATPSCQAVAVGQAAQRRTRAGFPAGSVIVPGRAGAVRRPGRMVAA
jgi:hypothetical protein